MSITFNWSVSKIQVIPVQDDKTNIVTKVEWLVKAVDEENKMASSVSGTRSFSLSGTFIPFEQLTEQQVLNWCFAPENVSVNDSEGNPTTVVKLLKDEAEAQVTDQIARQLAQKQSEPALPWLEIPA
jgi:hypothetical protein